MYVRILLQLFSKFVINGRFIQKLRPNFKVPKRYLFVQRLIPALYAKAIQDIVDHLSCKTDLTLGADHWSSKQGNSILAVTVKDTKDGAILLGLVDMSNERHTAINVQNQIERMMLNMKISWNQIAAICTDSPSNMQLMKRLLSSKQHIKLDFIH
jgi:hypothetical protein